VTYENSQLVHPTIRGRGAAANPTNRFETLDFAPDPDLDMPDPSDPDAFDPVSTATVYLKDTTRKIIATNDSPDIGFESSVNPYRGCEHGCIYCYARPTHEYLGFSAGLDFETRIMVKTEAPELLRGALSKPNWKPQTLFFSGVTDCYQPIERRLKLTRRCLEVLAEFGNPVAIVTKNALVERDIDILQKLAAQQAAAVYVSITTLNPDLTRIMEPRTSVPRRRLEAIAQLAAAKIPAGVMVAPVIPGLTDEEVPAILQAAANAGANFASYTMVRLPHGVAPLFEDWLGRHFPDRKSKILSRIRAIRQGKLNDPNFGSRMRGSGIWAEQLDAMFKLAKRKAGLDRVRVKLSTTSFRPAAKAQLDLF
jgi:DNA repair photolyase